MALDPFPCHHNTTTSAYFCIFLHLLRPLRPHDNRHRHTAPAIMMQYPTPQQTPYQQQQPPPPQQLQPPQRIANQLPPSNNTGYMPGNNTGDFAGTRNGRIYRLRVEQQPVRARMCGFGDKDRRPITPPPCIRLIVCDAATGQEIDANDVDSTFFVLMVDLWHEDSTHAVNLVRHSSAAPTVSISSSSTVSYPPPPERHSLMTTSIPMSMPMPGGAYGSHMPHQYYAQPQPIQYGHAPGSYVQQPQFYPHHHVPVVPVMNTATAQNHTRNLIGMNAVNACRLHDPSKKVGFWFVLQDLSVRTEGNFRLKLSMADIGNGDANNSVVTSGKCPVLASTFSESFTVYSAKKFPGVIESTALSKCFAQQGIKIPIRKDAPKTVANQDEFDADL
jgi:hypothetical protein